MWYEIKENRIILNIKAIPASSKNMIQEIIGGENIKIKIKAPAVEGAANKELIKFLSKTFKVPKSEISFISGETSKIKKISLPYNEKVKKFIEEKNEN